MDNNLKNLKTADLFRALAHPVRLCILKGLLENGKSNVSHMQECMELPQSTVSQHLQKLKSQGLVEAERNGLEVKYSIVNNEKVKQLILISFEGEILS
jgi:DNA-binding transcriptional ArsR family regulator